MNCPACGHHNREENQFCTQCGVQLAHAQKRSGWLITISEPQLDSMRRRRGGGESRTAPDRRQGIEISSQSFRLGRLPDNDFIIQDGQASARHAKITTDGQEFWVEDLDSTNGTYIDGVRIGERTRLMPESLIRIGSTIVKFAVQPLDRQAP